MRNINYKSLCLLLISSTALNFSYAAASSPRPLQDIFGKWTFIHDGKEEVFDLNRIEKGSDGSDIVIGFIEGGFTNNPIACVPAPEEVISGTGFEFLCVSSIFGGFTSVYGISFTGDSITKGAYGFGLHYSLATRAMLRGDIKVTGYRGHAPISNEPQHIPEPVKPPLSIVNNNIVKPRPKPNAVFNAESGTLSIAKLFSDGVSYKVVLHHKGDMQFIVYSAKENDEVDDGFVADNFDIITQKLTLEKVIYEGKTYRVEMIMKDGVFSIFSAFVVYI
jgi:hypothetical protein